MHAPARQSISIGTEQKADPARSAFCVDVKIA